MSRLVVVLPLSPLREGDRFAVNEWPLHITVLPPFLTDATGSEVGAAIRSAASAHPAFRVVAAQNELFGRRHDIPVTVMADNEQLAALHQALRVAVRPCAVAPDEPAFTGVGFRAHVTMKSHGRVHEGEEFTLTQIAVVDMEPRSSPGRTVLATVALPAAEGMVGP
ncbi:MAG: 2'-5' RNA ligase family protein [Homoserinimonas sp.]